MKSKYLGALKNLEFLEWDENRQNQYLNELGIFKYMLSSTCAPSIDSKTPGRINISAIFNSSEKIYLCQDDVAKDLYNFLLDRYYAYIKRYSLDFFIQFEDSIFGLKWEEARKKALLEFNTIYQNLNLLKNSKTSRFSLLNRERKYYISEISNERKMVLAYLTGNIEFFDVPLYNSNIYLQTVISFEGHLEILIELNNTYKFETDTYFDENSILFEKYKSIDNPPFTFEVFKFMNYQITLNKKNKFSDLVSLYFFLRDINMIKGPEKIIRSIINEFFQPLASELKLSNRENEKHIERIDLLKKDWKKFTP